MVTVAPLAVGVGLTVTFAVSDTEELPAVPLETYPADTTGVTLTDLVKVIVLVPVVIVAVVPLIEFGAVAEPLAMDFVA